MAESVANNAHDSETQAAFFARNTSKHTVKDVSEDTKHATKVDVGIYPNTDRIKQTVELSSGTTRRGDECVSAQPEPQPETESAPGTSAESGEPHTIDIDEASRRRWSARCSWADLLVPVEVKVDHSHSALEFLAENNSRTPFLRRTPSGRDAQAQLFNYVARIRAHQHRTHLYSIYVYRNKARIIYFDCGGCYVSTHFEYGTREHDTLHRFFWRLARMTPRQQGYDTTVRLASEEEIHSLKDYLCHARITPYVKDCVKRALSWNEGETAPQPSLWPLYVATHGTLQLLIGRPERWNLRVFGRCTRGYVAFVLNWENVRLCYPNADEPAPLEELDADRLAFLKDSWRSDQADITPEHKVYEYLGSLRKASTKDEITPQGAFNILNCFHGEDVGWMERHDTTSRQTTVAHEAGDKERRVHYRILLSPVCRPLSDFTNFKELATLLSQALHGKYRKSDILRNLRSDCFCCSARVGMVSQA